jgi:ATP-dependent DNA helicase RecG
VSRSRAPDPVEPGDELPPLPLVTGPTATMAIETLKGVGSRRGGVLREAGIETVADLLTRLPRRYIDRSRILPIAEAPAGEEVTLVVTVGSVQAAPTRRRGRGGPPHTVEVVDDSGRLRCVWFQGGRYHTFETGDVIALSGRIEVFRGQRQISHPEYEFVSDEGEGALLHTGRVIPLYGSSADLKERGLRSRGFRRLLAAALEVAGLVPTQLPVGVEERHGLMSMGQALRQVHFPQHADAAETARRRLAFEELYLLQRELEHRRRSLRSIPSAAIPASTRLLPRLREGLPFDLTAAQERCLEEIGADLARPEPMRRLLHGDVGSGKTLVAFGAALQAIEQGYQVALMAPTEILAEQHFHTLRRLAEGIGILDVVLFKGGARAALKRELRNGLASGATRLVVGTHALIEEDVEFAHLGLAIVDEQHRFGVAQRARLSQKGIGPGGSAIDLLIMTATPIPRSLALTLYGDLTVSVIDELPPGRQPVRTARRDPQRRDRIFAFVAEQVGQGRQAYVVYPLIEESAKSDLTSAEEGFRELSQGWLSDCRLGLLHGRLPADEKTATMERFAAGELDVLVATTVIEVGVDVPNATVMVIEHAERFGLAQLHQLRGRVGRGADDSYCILVAYPSETEGGDSDVRLEAMCTTSDGFELARTDLALRGPGEVLGKKQSGVPELIVAQLFRDEDLMEIARAEARSDGEPA